MKSTFVRSEEEAENIISFYFKPEKPVHYTAGQFTEIYLPHDKDNRGDKRWFTLSSSPSEQLLSITTNLSLEKSSSFKNELKNLEPGRQLNLAAPMGDFVLPKDATIPLVFVGGGIGVTPFHSIIKWLADKKEKRDITLLYAADTIEKIAFKELFTHLDDKFKIIINNPTPDWQGETGKLSAQKILDLAKPGDEHYIYVSGPEPMVEIVSKDLKKSGVNKKHVYTDFFPGYEY